MTVHDEATKLWRQVARTIDELKANCLEPDILYATEKARELLLYKFNYVRRDDQPEWSWEASKKWLAQNTERYEDLDLVVVPGRDIDFRVGVKVD